MDIIARDGATLVFVEVKARDGRAFGDAAEAVTMIKRRRMMQLALDYLTRHRLTGCPCRFDVVSIHLEAGGPAIEVFTNAFDVAGDWRLTLVLTTICLNYAKIPSPAAG